MIKAREIMTTPLISASEDNTLQEVIELLAKHSLSGLPVLDGEGRITGIISDTDIIRYSEQLRVVPLTNLSAWVSPHTDVSDLVSLRKGMESLHQTRVGEVMTRKVYSVQEKEPVNAVAALMNRRNINRVPVVNSENRAVGIITRADMVRCMARL